MIIFNDKGHYDDIVLLLLYLYVGTKINDDDGIDL